MSENDVGVADCATASHVKTKDPCCQNGESACRSSASIRLQLQENDNAFYHTVIMPKLLVVNGQRCM